MYTGLIIRVQGDKYLGILWSIDENLQCNLTLCCIQCSKSNVIWLHKSMFFVKDNIFLSTRSDQISDTLQTTAINAFFC